MLCVGTTPHRGYLALRGCPLLGGVGQARRPVPTDLPERGLPLRAEPEEGGVFNSPSPIASTTPSPIALATKKEVDRKAVWRLFKIYERLYFEFGFRPLHEAMNESQARTPVERSSPLDSA